MFKLPSVLTDLSGSEKAVYSIALIIVGSVLFGVGKLTADQWTNFVALIAGIYLGAKGVQGAAQVIANAKNNDEPPEAK